MQTKSTTYFENKIPKNLLNNQNYITSLEDKIKIGNIIRNIIAPFDILLLILFCLFGISLIPLNIFTISIFFIVLGIMFIKLIIIPKQNIINKITFTSYKKDERIILK